MPIDFDLDEQLTLDQARAYLARCGVHIQPVTLRAWISRGHLVATYGSDGRRRVTVLALARAEHATRRHARRTLVKAA